MATDDKKEKLKALNLAVEKIDKEHGKGSVMRLGDSKIMQVEVIPTGSLGVDIALGVGGFPKGRVVEIYGPESSGKTTLSIQAIANCQKQGGIAAFIDAEHAFDKAYAEKLGVNVNELLISQPDNGEQALSITEKLIQSGAIDIIVIDSVAALVPKSELEGEMGESKMGLHARLMSQALRKLTGVISKTGCCCIFINQLREKIGVMFGCLHGDTLVNFTDGRSIPIKKVVEEKIQGSVWSLDEKSGQIEEKPITDWHFNGKVAAREDFIHIETAGLDGQWRMGITVTPNHKILTQKGWKEAKDINFSDKLASRYLSILNSSFGNFFYGCSVGDSTILIRTNATANIKFQDKKNIDYLKWKIEKMSKHLSFTPNNTKHGIKYVSDFSSEFKKIKTDYPNRDTEAFFNNYSPLGLAIWFMDDVHFDNKNSHCRYLLSIKRYKKDKDKLEQIKNRFNNGLGVNCDFDKDGTICFNKEDSLKIASIICKYVPKSMQYKLPKEYQEKYEDFELESSPTIKTEFVDITSIRFGSAKQMRTPGKYDISIADNHNYMAGGVNNGLIVHNSPEVTTGGNALKFYASVRIDIRRIGQIKDGDALTGNRTRVKIAKNKLAPPFKTCEFDIIYGQGVSKTGEIVDIGSELGVIQKSGSWFSYEGTKLGQGRDSVKQLLEDNPEMAIEIEGKIKAKYAQSPEVPRADEVNAN